MPANPTETPLARARSLQAERRYDEAERAFRDAIAAGDAIYGAHLELAELRWLRSSDADAALADLNAAITATPGDLRLQAVKAAALQYAGRREESLALLHALSAAHPDNPHLAVLAAQSAAGAGAPDALVLAERAVTLAPQQNAARIALAEACLVAGDAARAASIAEDLQRHAPQDQYAIALQATAWRLLGDPRYRALYDYDAFVSASLIDVPSGWRDRSDYLADLGAALRGAHEHGTHPFGQSVRDGSQATDILQIDHPAIRALPSALDGPIRKHLAKLGDGDDPVRARNTGRCKFQGMWSILMRAGGHHVDHVHPDGWLSSACYVELPDVSRGREGWLRFGKPGAHTSPALDAEHFIQPAPGMLALFPSYMWHGAIPFTHEGARLTFAFDLVPVS